jgi:hypothetical protein
VEDSPLITTPAVKYIHIVNLLSQKYCKSFQRKTATEDVDFTSVQVIRTRSNPTVVTTSVEGTPKRRWLKNERLYPEICALLACSHTIKLAAEPRRDRLPATVLTNARTSHAFVTSDGEILAAEAATLVPSSRTE